jgi:Flp pilus assembly pilin Flp
MLRTIEYVLRDDRGQGLTEYAIILALVSVAAAAVLLVLSTAINGELSGSATDI